MTTRKHHLRRHAARVAVAASLVATVTGVQGPGAGADQLSGLRAQAQALVGRIQTLGQQEDALSEQYDAAGIAVQTADARVSQAAAALAAAQAAAATARSALGREALDAYTGESATPAIGGSGTLGTATAGLLGAEYVNSLAATQQDALDGYHLATLQAKTAQATLQQAQVAAQAQVNTLAKARSSVQATQDQLEGALQQDQGQIATLVAQIQAQQAAAAAAAAAKAAQARQAAQAQAQAEAQAAAAQAAGRAAASRSATPARTTTGVVAPIAAIPATTDPSVGAPAPSAVVVDQPAPPVGSGASGAVQAALSRVGDPYVWGAAGPSSFDCSGLVQWAYAQVGISLPHYSGAQYADGTRISMSDLEPGDLVFFSDPGEHVAIYVGGGDIVEAPHTGADVHVVPMYAEFVQAVRIS